MTIFECIPNGGSLGSHTELEYFERTLQRRSNMSALRLSEGRYAFFMLYASRRQHLADRRSVAPLLANAAAAAAERSLLDKAEEKKLNRIPQVAASEKGTAQRRSRRRVTVARRCGAQARRMCRLPVVVGSLDRDVAEGARPVPTAVVGNALAGLPTKYDYETDSEQVPRGKVEKNFEERVQQDVKPFGSKPMELSSFGRQSVETVRSDERHLGVSHWASGHVAPPMSGRRTMHLPTSGVTSDGWPSKGSRRRVNAHCGA
uniref:Uncharacterized protein n=1 Tax=Trichuris muris TaxID=70415 RepID=A0A5S6Q1Z9_TRIMR